jgi:hypothetical protein
MKLDINIAAEQFKKQLIDTINQAGEVLPPVLINYIVQDISADVAQTYQNIIHQQQIELAKQNEQEDKDKED